MPDSILYLLKANLAIILFYLGYRLLLRKLTFYTLNRFYLLFALLFSFIYPLANIGKLFEKPVQELPGEVVYIIPDWEQVPAGAFNGWPLLIGLIAAGAVWFAVRLLIRLLSLRPIHRQSYAATWHWFNYRQVVAPIRPFSFWRNIYVNVQSHAEGELTEIFRHEQVHVSELHTLDVLLAELCSVLCWFNPGMWLLRHAIRENLEFITDRDVLRSGVDKKVYQYSLLGVGRHLDDYPAIAQGFSFKNLKRRIMMMNKKNSSRLQLGRYLLVVPVISVFVLLFTMSRAAYLPHIADIDPIAGGSEKLLMVEFMPDELEHRDEAQGRGVDREQDKPKVTVVVLPEKDTVQEDIVRDTIKPKRNPLFILDGDVLGEGFDIKSIYANTIESINVLKDAKATSLYGKRGVNGVVVITSKEKAQQETAKTDTMALREIRIIGYGKEAATQTDALAVGGDFKGALIVIDSKESTAALLRQLSPDEIKSMDVLKGPDATDKYGDKGKKGVIEVSTTRGK